MAVEPDPA